MRGKVLQTLQPRLLALLVALSVVGAGCSSVPRSEMPGPVQNIDHWHSVYGVYSCDRQGDGAERYLPAFQSTEDDHGIHSHGDGLIHIHPFFERSDGANARFALWFDQMDIQVSPSRLKVDNVFDESVFLVAGEQCSDGTGPAEIRILQWDKPFDPADPPPPDNVFTEDFGSIRFVADEEVFVIAYANASSFADLPGPPADRFEALPNVSPMIDWNPQDASSN